MDESSVNIDANPPTPTDTVEYRVQSLGRYDFGRSRVTSNDVSHVINRYNWTSGTVYDQFDNQDSTILSFILCCNRRLQRLQVYVQQSWWAQSTVMPSSINTSWSFGDNLLTDTSGSTCIPSPPLTYSSSSQPHSSQSIVYEQTISPT